MKIERTRAPDSRIERQIVMGMVVSTEFLIEIKPLYTPKAFNIDYAREVSSWCMEYFEEYKKAPGKNIEEIFHSHASNGMREEQVELVSAFLLSISDEYERGEEINVSYLLDNAEKHFRLTSLSRLRTDIGQSIASGRLADAEAIVKGYVRVTRPETEGVDPMTDISVISNALREENREGMFSLPGDLGRAVGDFHRGHLIGVLGAPGVGKTWWLQQLAIRGALRGYNVLFVSLEMDRDQMVRRMQHSLTGLPNRRFSGKLLLPVFDCEFNQDDSCTKEYRTCRIGVMGRDGKMTFQEASKKYVLCTACKGDERRGRNYRFAVWHKEITREELDTKRAIIKAKKIIKSNILRGNRLKLVCYPSNTFTEYALRAYLYNLEHYENFIVDMIVTDYAQKFKHENIKQETRHKIRDIWDAHKSIAQQRHILVATASQTSAARSGRDAQRGDWSEGIAPLEVCDVGYILNQSPEEKDMGLMRVRVAKQRHDEYELTGEVKVLYSYKIGQTYLDSYYGK